MTGIYMAQWYDPTPELANEAVRHIMTHVWLGAFARGVHFWAAQAMFVTALLHMLRVFLHACYKRPREGNWVVGAAMLLLTFLSVFIGTMLKWDQEGVEALSHNLDVAAILGGVGVWFTAGLSPRVPLLFRLCTAHAVIIPGLVLALFFLQEYGFFHADPHPGSLFIEADGRIGLIDFGMVGQDSQPTRQHLAALLAGFSRHDRHRIAPALALRSSQGQSSSRIDTLGGASQGRGFDHKRFVTVWLASRCGIRSDARMATQNASAQTR